MRGEGGGGSTVYFPAMSQTGAVFTRTSVPRRLGDF